MRFFLGRVDPHFFGKPCSWSRPEPTGHHLALQGPDVQGQKESEAILPIGSCALVINDAHCSAFPRIFPDKLRILFYLFQPKKTLRFYLTF